MSDNLYGNGNPLMINSGMSDVEQRARDALNEVAKERRQGQWHSTWPRSIDTALEAVCRLIEQHDVYKLNASEASKLVVATLERYGQPAEVVKGVLSCFILPEPVDPLIETMNEMGFGMSKTTADEFRQALAKRGLTITKEPTP